MKKLMQSDIFLRILSVVVAVLCWIYIVFITNPEIEVKISDIPVTLADHQSIKNAGYIVSNEINTTVDIKVKGTRRMLADLNKDSILAYVDLSDCTDKTTYELPVNIRLPYEDISLVSTSVHKVAIYVDNYITRDFPVNYTYSGDLKSKNYMVQETKLYTPTVSVSGPESIIKTIEEATVTIELDGASDDITGFAPVNLLNSNNAVVSQKNLDIKNKDVSFKCIVYGKKNVDVKPSLSGDSSDYECTVTDHPTITLVGPASDIDAISSISTKPFYVNDQNLPQTYMAELIIPENISIEENIKTVNILVEKI